MLIFSNACKILDVRDPDFAWFCCPVKCKGRKHWGKQADDGNQDFHSVETGLKCNLTAVNSLFLQYVEQGLKRAWRWLWSASLCFSAGLYSKCTHTDIQVTASQLWESRWPLLLWYYLSLTEAQPAVSQLSSMGPSKGLSGSWEISRRRGSGMERRAWRCLCCQTQGWGDVKSGRTVRAQGSLAGIRHLKLCLPQGLLQEWIQTVRLGWRARAGGKKRKQWPPDLPSVTNGKWWCAQKSMKKAFPCIQRKIKA